MRGDGKKKFLFGVSQASSVPWDWNGIPGEDAWCEDYGAYKLAYYLISKSPFRDAKYLVEETTTNLACPRSNQLFVVDTDSDLFTVDIGVTPPRPLRLVEGPGDKSSQLWSKFYLVDVKDQGILMVERIYESERTRAFKVFQLSLDGKDWKLIMKEDLGDIALFVGGSSTFAVAATSVSGCLANHIYFLQDWNGIAMEDAWRDDYGSYNRSIHLISKTPFRDAMYLIEDSRLPPIWLLPTLFLISI